MPDNDEYFEIAFQKLCELEGYTSDLQGDLGGRTIWGISERNFPEVVSAMSNMSPEESKAYAQSFYLTNFWNKYDCASLPYPYNIIFFCMLVNAPKPSINARNQTANWRDFLFKMQLYYSSLVDRNKDQSKFFRGWINRTLRLWNVFYEEEL